MTAQAQKIEPEKALTPQEDFELQLREQEQEISSQLPTHVSKEKFFNSAIVAFKQNPDLLKCSARSAFGAITKSAQDGLLPDGREGIITPYKKDAQWNPMTYGLRKRARELDDIIIDAQVVHENDTFVLHQGDEPHIEHKPAHLGEARGKMIGAYAIFRQGDEILHREVMDRQQIEDVRSQSRAGESLMWKKFTGEAWRKTVVRRGIKTVPCSEKLEQVVRRDDENFDFGEQIRDITPPSPPPAPTEDKGAEPKETDKAEIEDAEIVDDKTMEDPSAYLNALEEQMAGAVQSNDRTAFAEIWDDHMQQRDKMFPPDAEKAQALYDKYSRRFKTA